MAELQRWHLEASFVPQIAADVRQSRTNYTDDQCWQLAPGIGDAPALAFQTRYGGRVGLVSLVPMWVQDSRVIYQAQTYAEPPTLTSFAPNFLQLDGKITPELKLTAEHWVMESQAAGTRYTLHNTGTQPQTIRLDLFGHVGAEKKERPAAIISLANETNALFLGRFPSLEPVVVLENASVQLTPGTKASPKIGVDLTIPAGEHFQIRWVHAGLNRMAASLERAQFWLAQDWDAAFQQIRQLAQAVPQVETGSTADDLAIAAAFNQLIQAFIHPTEHLPYASFVATRQPARGFSRRGDGTDYDRGWNGQSPQLAYLAAATVATIDPKLAEGVILNYLAVQNQDGSIDSKPGLGGQREGMLCPPILARLAWTVYQRTENKTFLKEVYPKLVDFLNRWAEEDLDADRDTLPEWQDERQTGYIFFPTFGSGQPWAQNLDIRHVETPDLVGYLISEAICLQHMAQALEDPGAYELENRAVELRRRLQRLWYKPGSHYAYHDRDTDAVSTRVTIIEDGRGDEEQLPALKLDAPSRVIVHVEGGTGKTPRASLYLTGTDSKGNPVEETVDLKDFRWSYSNGVYTSQHVFSIVDRIRFEGLSRVYRIHAYTVDLTRLDINAIIPILDPHLPEEHRNTTINRVKDENHFLRNSGLTIVSAQDANFDPSSANGGGGTWTYWTTIIGETLIQHGEHELATTLVKRLLKTQTEVLATQHHFSEFYHSDKPAGLGETHYLGGIVPLHILMQVVGVQIINSGRVWAGGKFTWGSPVTIRQHGVTVTRSADGTKVEFPSGHTAALDANAEWQPVIDPTATVSETPQATLPAPPDTSAAETPVRVIIEVEPDTDES